ncbi:MAG: hypothetical protein U0Q03_18695 [Acidimicrobiales bacterium]
MTTTEFRERASETIPATEPGAASDVEIARCAADVVSVPRSSPADSFVLHAPLELLARTGLLPFVDPAFREEARRRIAGIATAFAAVGEPVAPPATIDPSSVDEAAARLTEAITRGDLDDVDAAAAWLGEHVRPADLPRLLGDALVPLLGAAGHAPIFLWLHPRVAPRREVTASLLRPLCRELARRPEWRLHWIDEPRPHCDDTPVTAASLAEALAATPLLGRPASTFIHPLMSRIDSADLAGTLGTLCGGSSVGHRARALLRVAAWSMLDEPGDEAPYGWSHCLTMPQAVVGVADGCADPSRALAVAASHVYGFRASLATRHLDVSRADSWTADARMPIADALAAGPETARAVAWQLPTGRFDALRTAVATTAAVHHDAHLAKYVLACLDGAGADPAAERLFLAAAATLCGWWASHPDGIEIG